MGWPTAYRNQSAREQGGGGSQNQPPSGAAGGFSAPAPPGGSVIPTAGGAAAGGAAGGAAADQVAGHALAAGARWAARRLFPRLVPGLSQAMLAYDLYELWQWTESKKDLAPQVPGFPTQAPGWNLHYECPSFGPQYTPAMATSVTNSPSCPQTKTDLDQQYDASVALKMIDFSTFWQSVFGSGLFRVDPTHWRWRVWKVYRFPKSPGDVAKPWVWNPALIPVFTPYVSPVIPLPVPLPQLDPLSVPIGQPIAPPRTAPKPRTVRPPNPYRSPTEQTQTGPQPASRGQARPQAQPSLSFPPQGPPKVGAPVSPIRRPPKKGEKEKKLKTTPTGVVAAVLNTATEGADVVDALYKAIPRNKRPPRDYTNPIQKGLFVYDHFGDIDWSRAIKNLVANQIEDAVFGAVGRQASKASKAAGQLAPALGLGRNPAGKLTPPQFHGGY